MPDPVPLLEIFIERGWFLAAFMFLANIVLVVMCWRLYAELLESYKNQRHQQERHIDELGRLSTLVEAQTKLLEKMDEREWMRRESRMRSLESLDRRQDGP